MDVEARENKRERDEDATPLISKMEEGATNHRMQAASRSWKSQGNRASLEPAEGMQTCQHLSVSPVRPILEFKTQEL